MNFNGKGKYFRVVSFMGFLLLFGGCAGKQRGHPLITLTGKTPLRVCRVAVLPFQNQTKIQAVGLMLSRIVLAEMVRLGSYEVIEEGMIRRVLLRGEIYPGQSINPEIRSMIANSTRADAILSGEVVDAMEEKDRVHLAFNLRMRDTKTGRLLWTTYYARNGENYRKIMHFGEIDTLAGLAKQMVDDVLKSWREKGLGGCNR